MNKFEILFPDTKIIRDFEGFSLKAYPDPITHAEPYTISYGLTGSWVTPGLVISETEAIERFMGRIQDLTQQIDKLLKVQLTKNQFIALLSFAWNLGIGSLKESTLLKLINDSKFQEAAGEFVLWDRAGGKAIAGLLRRREAERDLFLQK